MSVRNVLLGAVGLVLGAGFVVVFLFSSFAQYSVRHEPYLQLGDAPLVGFDGSAVDQVQLIWQTVPMGWGDKDSFTVEYRAVGDEEWVEVGPISRVDTGVEGRVNHHVDLTGLGFDAAYEYRVRHQRPRGTIETFESVFRTRLQSGNGGEFSFAAYGDSSRAKELGPFRLVQARINRIAPDFVMLLGDNAYNAGTHWEYDGRFRADWNPEASEWNAGHIDYVSFGNHDIVAFEGLPTEENYAVPIQVAGVTAGSAPPSTERAEQNYSFDYGSVHFATFNSNSRDDPVRLAGLIDWLTADLAASQQPWKIVFAHHPVAGTPDQPEVPSGNYYSSLIPALLDADVDVFMVGHSHTYSRTYPLTGLSGGEATFVWYEDPSAYTAGDGVVQVVTGSGGGALRPGSYDDFPFVAVGYSLSTDPLVEFGFTLVSVSPSVLTFSYIAADDGAIIDSFSIRK